MNDLAPSLLLSLEIASAATLLTALLAIPLAFLMTRWRFPGSSFVEALIMVPLVLPPTVVGYLLLISLGRRGFIGSFLSRAFDYSIVFRFEGAVLAAMVVAIPMLYIPAKAAFQNVDRELEDVARTMGAGRLQMFWHVSLPLARRGILGGLILAFARAVGEFGATVMVYGRQANHLTLPISIYEDYESNHLAHSALAVAALGIMSLALIMTYNHLARTGRE